MKCQEFVCGACGGKLVKVRTGRFNRAIYNCQQCQANELYECTICHKPRQIWANEDKTICAFCFLNYLDGKVRLKPSQVYMIREWKNKTRFIK